MLEIIRVYRQVYHARISVSVRCVKKAALNMFSLMMMTMTKVKPMHRQAGYFLVTYG